MQFFRPPSTSFALLPAAIAIAIASPFTAAAEPPSDPKSIWTLQDENASISTNSLTDRFYVNGLRIGWTSPTDSLPRVLSGIDRQIWGDGRQRISIDLSQSIFTPADTAASNPPLNDRPYAGTLAVTAALLNDTDRSRSTLAVSLGLVGPTSGAEWVQNTFHDIIGQSVNRGWHYQLQDEPTIQLLGQRVWRLPITEFGSAGSGLEVDALPALSAGLGSVRVYGATGMLVRLGQGLQSDFGPARVAPGRSGGDAFTQTQPFAWYVFGGIDGQAVGYDITLNGNNFRTSRSVVPTTLVAEFQAGLAFLYRGWRFSYTQVFQTQEFAHQRGGLHQFGSFAVSTHF